MKQSIISTRSLVLALHTSQQVVPTQIPNPLVCVRWMGSYLSQKRMLVSQALKTMSVWSIDKHSALRLKAVLTNPNRISLQLWNRSTGQTWWKTTDKGDVQSYSEDPFSSVKKHICSGKEKRMDEGFCFFLLLQFNSAVFSIKLHSNEQKDCHLFPWTVIKRHHSCGPAWSYATTKWDVNHSTSNTPRQRALR